MNNVKYPSFLLPLAWTLNPTVTKVDTINYPIEKVGFPTVTLCPENSNPQRFGPAIQVLDYLKRQCPADG